MPRPSMTRKRRAAIFARHEMPVLPLLDAEAGRGRHLSVERVAEVRSEALRLLCLGFTQSQIAEAMNISRSRLSRWCVAEVEATSASPRLLKLKGRSLIDRILDRIDQSGGDDACWPWTGGRKPNGYGTYNFRGKGYNAHRLVYETFVEPIPCGLVIDHICKNRACVNPRHLEPVTQSVNVRRGDRW